MTFMLKVVYCSWLLLLWLTALYVVTGLGGQDDTLRCFRVFATFPLKLFLLQEPDPWHRLARHGLHHPQLPPGADHRHLINRQNTKNL